MTLLTLLGALPGQASVVESPAKGLTSPESTTAKRLLKGIPKFPRTDAVHTLGPLPGLHGNPPVVKEFVKDVPERDGILKFSTMEMMALSDIGHSWDWE